jgi:hypothetical protein
MNFLLAFIFAVTLPTFDDFRRTDRVRRQAGQWQSVDTDRLMRVPSSLVIDIAKRNPDDWEIQWGAAELLNDWKQKQPQFEMALTLSGTNSAVALRYACAAAAEHQAAIASRWLAYCQLHEQTNCVPWLAELWLRRVCGATKEFREPKGGDMMFRDCSGNAARARIRALEAAGYSKYAARRIGFLPKLYAVQMAQDLRREKPAANLDVFLLGVARAMQTDATFIVTELAGESLESAVWDRRTDSPEKMSRLEAMMERRLALTQLLQETERRVDVVPEERMVMYFDDLLFRGEAVAMQRLSLEIGSVPVR